MKKVIGLLGVAVMAIAVYANSSVTTGSNEIDLTFLTSINKAEAEAPCIGNHFIILPRPGGWRCISGGYSCCPLL
ncbi:hypothetical protein [Maribacter sp. 2304DJ31-5]|uniref:hypothetical protein n=1 Tax=Maribacter sp. 2304DJ31-5 TaxID=3386273 RepID=UPI0039BD4518